MGAGVPPQSIILAKLKARHELAHSQEDVMEQVFEIINKKKEAREYLLKVYRFDLEVHEANFNKHRIHNSNGCPCVLCKTLSEYVRAKMYFHKFKKGYYNPEYNVNFNLFDYEYTKSFPVVSNNLSEQEFFEQTSETLKKQIQERRIEYKSVEDAINSFLEKV